MNGALKDPRRAVAHLRPEVWAHVNRRLVVKAISEFSHELLIAPQATGSEGRFTRYTLATDVHGVEYQFRARVLSLDHWYIDQASLEKRVDGREAPLDAMSFIVELRERLAIGTDVLPGYLEEIASTLYGAAYKHVSQRFTASELARASFQEVETAMTEGHPIFVANNGRLGFCADDYAAYAPEAATPLRLVWLAAKRERVNFACVADLSYARLIQEELGGAALARFGAELVRHGLEPLDYVFLPVHPWQWQNRVAQLFAADLAARELVYVGEGPDQYQPQQSIRTSFNTSEPTKRYVKTALSILNMGFTRGLSSSMVSSWAKVNDWVSALVHADAHLQDMGFGLLREVAFIGLRHRYYERASNRRVDPYKEMLGALWRESPSAGRAPGQRLMTMAALMHLDKDGGSTLTALIRSSGVSIDVWLSGYLRAYLKPLVHCFYRYGLVFTPHCENVILVLENDVPAGAILKDLAEDIGVLNPETPLPEGVRHLALRVPEDVMTLSIFTDSFDCVFRFLAHILYEHAGYPEQRFWRNVAACIREYEREHPELSAKFRRYDLFASTFIRNCLNRLQLRNNRMMVDLNAADPVDSLQFVGTLKNPIAGLDAAEEQHVAL